MIICHELVLFLFFPTFPAYCNVNKAVSSNTKFALLSDAQQMANLIMNALVFVELRNIPVGRIVS